MKITFTQKGDFSKTESFLKRMQTAWYMGVFDKYGALGVELLEAATPKDTGITANSWSYLVEKSRKGIKLIWRNSSNTPDGVPIVFLLHYGHATRDGGFYEGTGFLSEPLAEAMNGLNRALWQEVTRK